MWLITGEISEFQVSSCVERLVNLVHSFRVYICVCHRRNKSLFRYISSSLVIPLIRLAIVFSSRLRQLFSVSCFLLIILKIECSVRLTVSVLGIRSNEAGLIYSYAQLMFVAMLACVDKLLKNQCYT